MSTGRGRRDVERVVSDEIRRVLREQDKPDADVLPEDALDADLGLSSSDVVRVAGLLATRLGVDPFARSASITDVRTVDDLRRLFARLL